MKEDEGKKYSYRFGCADFELEFSGDENFMQAMIRKYEFKVLAKLNQLVPPDKAPQPQAQQQPPAQQQQQQRPPQPRPQQQPQRPPEKPRYPDKGRFGRRGGQRNKPQDNYQKSSIEQKREPDHYMHHALRSEEMPEQVSAETAAKIEAEEIRSLFEKYHPQTSHDRVMIFAYYLEQKFEGEFTTAEVGGCYQSLSEKSPSNLSTVLNNATRSGFLTKEEKSGRIKYRLTFKGKRYVENGLRLD